MEVVELIDLAIWYQKQFKLLHSRYSELLNVLAHNANRQDQQPVEATLNELVNHLSNMDIQSLTLQQEKILDKLNVWSLIGKQGARSIEQRVTSTSYDPATLVQELHDIVNNISTVHQHLDKFKQVLNEIGILEPLPKPDPENLIVRICFQNEVGINNIPELKNRTKDLYDIVRGISMSAGIRPDEIKIVGTANGSLIINLACTALVVKIFADIITHITRVTIDIIEVRKSIEELKQKKIYTETIIKEMNRIEENRKEEGFSKVKAEAKKFLKKGVAGDTQNALDKSIEKLMVFLDKGGDIDFQLFPDDSNDEDTEGVELSSEVLAAKKSITSYKEERVRIYQIENKEK